MKVQLFVPCFIDQFYPETAENTVKILKKLGCEVHYNPAQTCCGQPAFNSGYLKEARALANKFFDDFSPQMPIVTPSGSCAGYIRKHYATLFEGDESKLEACEALKANMFELSDFIVNELGVTDLGARFPHKVTYHEACSSIREYGLMGEPQMLLKGVADLEFIEMPNSDVCCGFGGTFSVKHTAISSAMVEQKVRGALTTGAEYIVSTEASCLMNINGYCQKQKMPIKGIHLADILSCF